MEHVPERKHGRLLVADTVAIGQSFLGILALCAGLELASRTGLIPPEFFPPLSHTLRVLLTLFGEPLFWRALANTMQGWAIGLGIAVILAMPIGLIAGSNEFVYRGLRPLIEFLRPVPSVALIPLAILTLGTGLASKTFLVAIASFWPILIQTIYGSHDRDPAHYETAA